MEAAEEVTMNQPKKELLFQAIFNCKIRALERMLDSGIDIDVRDSFLRTPLICATSIEEEHVRNHVVRLLIKRGADINAQDDNGRTALIEACGTINRDNVIRRLLRTNRCDVNIADNSGSTALLHAVSSGNLSAIRTLVNSSGSKESIRVDDVNLRGVSPLELALKLGQAKCVQLLVQDGKADTSKVSSPKLLNQMLQYEMQNEDLPKPDFANHAKRRRSVPVLSCNMLPITELNLDAPDQLQRLCLSPRAKSRAPSKKIEKLLESSLKLHDASSDESDANK
ncbi:hypothetical protein CAPTEDRAFT_224623, partial [Capitella teleta]